MPPQDFIVLGFNAPYWIWTNVLIPLSGNCVISQKAKGALLAGLLIASSRVMYGKYLLRQANAPMFMQCIDIWPHPKATFRIRTTCAPK